MQPIEEKVIETKICKHCNIKFDITDKDLEFYDKVSPVFNGTKYSIPTPTLCPDCRQQRRLSFRNERNLYKRTCDATGKNIISIYSPDKPYKVYDQNEWWSDKWDPKSYGRDFDFSRPFFEQFEELMIKVPHSSNISVGNENSPYVNLTVGSKNCYLTFGNLSSEDCYYSNSIRFCQNSLDSSYIFESNNIFNSINIYKSSNIFNSINLSDCNNCFYCKNCSGCNNCFGSFGLINKEYYFFNEKYDEKTYLEKIKLFIDKNNINLNEFIKKYFLNFINKNNDNQNNEGIILGEYIKNSKDIFYSFDIDNSQNISFSSDIKNTNTLFDTNVAADNSILSYECLAIGKNSYKSLMSFIIQDVNELIYSFNCYSSSHLFGCIGLRNSSYCILNKQYTKEQYETLVPKIIEHMKNIGEWGEFFPSSISPFGYNETVANEYYPLSKEETQEKGFKYSTYENPTPQVSKTIPANKLPEDIKDIPDDILNWAITCEITGKPFRIIKQELEFYRKHNLPIPRRHPDQRHLDRMKLRNPRKLYDRVCDNPNCVQVHKDKNLFKQEEFEINPKTNKLSKKIKTTYSPDREEIVYCEECYNREVL